ncbi:MAG: hypothetical protein BIFFINMI_01910 [Phycisphaerae bacterium]|nr:hypothetical protein [Phycisphaerae bacterium]
MADQVCNPWRKLPESEPYVLPDDAAALAKFNATVPARFEVHTELLPEPFIGRPDAPVVLLNLNPGYSPNDWKNHTDPAFATKARGNLLHKRTDYPFYLFDPSESRSLGFKWWQRKLRALVDDCGRKAVAQSVLCVEYFPYHSQHYAGPRLAVPSQQYSFDLVRSAIRREAMIVIMRSEALWHRAVPELQSYGQAFTVHSVQNPSISPKNCPGYQKVVEAIRPCSRS